MSEGRASALKWQRLLEFTEIFEKWKIVYTELEKPEDIEKQGQLWEKERNERLSTQDLILPSNNFGTVA